MSQGIRIHVVDDDESLRDVLAMVLEEDGHRVTKSSTGDEAWAYFQTDPVPLVITDIRMPGMDGIELLSKIKDLSPQTQVITITSYASVETAVAALRAGAYDYLVKPFESIDLVSAIVRRATEKILLLQENQTLIESLMRNQEELEHLNQKLKKLAIRDTLTSLYNHRYFMEALNNETARARRHGNVFSLLFLDIDKFKNINDRLGHPKGDQILKLVSEILIKRMRQTDLVARYGGEEFAVLLPETPKTHGIFCAREICQIIADFPFEGREVQPGGQITVSIGVASFPEDADEAVGLIQEADAAMYEAKANGGNQVVHL